MTNLIYCEYAKTGLSCPIISAHKYDSPKHKRTQFSENNYTLNVCPQTFSLKTHTQNIHSFILEGWQKTSTNVFVHFTLVLVLEQLYGVA